MAAAFGVPTSEPRWNHPGVVKHQEITRSKMRRKILKPLMLEVMPSSPDHKKPRLVALGRRGLGDESGRQVKAKIRGSHCASVIPDCGD